MTVPSCDRLRFERAVAAHLPFLVALQKSRDTTRFLGGITRIADPWTDHFVVFEGDQPLAAAGLVGVDERQGEIYCIVADDVREADIATDACNALLRWAWDEKHLSRVLAFVSQANVPATGLIKKLLFRECPELRSSDRHEIPFVRERPADGGNDR
jgi:RimJ/RimL family protein N-acetyltransferase